MAIETGMQRGELLNARWEHIDRGKRLLHIPETKTGHSRAIPQISMAIRVIEASGNQQQEHILPFTANALRLAWERLCKRCNINNFRFHDLRHEAISCSIELGILMSLLSVDVLKCYKPTPAVYRLVTESFKYSPSYVTRQRM